MESFDEDQHIVLPVGQGWFIDNSRVRVSALKEKCSLYISSSSELPTREGKLHKFLLLTCLSQNLK